MLAILVGYAPAAAQDAHVAQRTYAAPAVHPGQEDPRPKAQDASPASDAPPAWALALPLRFDLVRDAPPVERLFLGCQTDPDPKPVGFPGLPTTRRPMQLIPRLSLNPLYRAGCVVDRGVGLAATHWTALGRNEWLVFSGGAMVFNPSVAAEVGRPNVTRTARVDLLMRTTKSSAVTVGVGLSGLHVGGIF